MVTKVAKADILLDAAYTALGLAGKPALEKYVEMPRIVAHLAGVHAASPVSVGTTGTITERLCVLGLEQIKDTVAGFEYRHFRKDWQWIGDLLVSGDPYDLAISVKSYKAKERLLASGTGSLLTPTIGWGLFDDESEWSAERTASYLYRGFVAVYMPATTLSRIDAAARRVANINGKVLLRDLQEFPADISRAIPTGGVRVDCRKL